jgi:streptogramin lyase
LAGADPFEDDGFTDATPPPDVDLIVVREKAYGAGGIDLGAYGLGNPDYVQSIYFRLFADTNTSTENSYTGRITFSEGVEILSFIAGNADLGGETNDGIATATDAIFGISSNPDDYSQESRGIETSGGTGGADFINQTSLRSFVFGLNIGGGVDDFRVIIDYGSSFPSDISFDIEAYNVGNLGGVTPQDGIRVGNDASPVVFGSGDYGETQGLLDIPLTTNVAPTPTNTVSLDPRASVFIVRDPGANAAVDGIDTTFDLPAPNLFTASGISTPAGITNGFDGHIYVIGANGGFAAINPGSQAVQVTTIADLSGTSTDLAALADRNELFVSRNTGGNTFVDRLDRTTLAYTENIEISASLLSSPIAIAAGADGLLYVLGGTTGFVSVDPRTSQVTSIGLSPPSGKYTSLTGRPGFEKLYLVRDTIGDTQIDVFDVASGTTTYGFSSFPMPSAPIGITNGPDEQLYVIGKGASAPAILAVINPDSGAVERTLDFLDFAGSNVEITNFFSELVFCDSFEDQGCIVITP